MEKQVINLDDDYKRTAMTIVDTKGNSWLWAAYNIPRIGEKMRLPTSNGPILAEIGEVLYDLSENKVVIVVK